MGCYANGPREVGLQRKRACRGSHGTELGDWTAGRKWARKGAETSEQPWAKGVDGWLTKCKWILPAVFAAWAELEGLKYSGVPEVLSQYEAVVFTALRFLSIFLPGGTSTPRIWLVCPLSSCGITPRPVSLETPASLLLAELYSATSIFYYTGRPGMDFSVELSLKFWGYV